jgi:transglutaminase-like putative cysteine protease
MKNTLLLLSFFLTLISNAQEKYAVANLTAELTEKSNSVILQQDIRVTIDDYDDMTISEDKIITILNEKGMSALDAYAFYNKSTKIRNLEVTIYDALGSEIETFKERDFMDVNAVGSVSLYTDDRVKYLEYTPASYPVTIHFEKEIKTSNTAFIKSFTPYVDYYQSIKSSTFQIENKSEIVLRSSENGFMEEVSIENDNPNLLTYSVSNLPSVSREVYSPSFETFTPKVMFALQTFELAGERGEVSNWEELGLWQHENLLKGLDQLPESTISEIKLLTQNLETTREKAKAIYEYVQNNTRYISVQIGLGGWKPISAEEVDDKKYGDCKGLTNYTKALLNLVDIESNYCVVYSGSEIQDISEDFTSMQGDHVILNIPQENEEDIWLECTSQDIPFNFLGTFTDDRKVLAVKPSGGEILRTPAYTEIDNYQKTTAEINIIEKAITADVKIKTRGTQYNNRYSLYVKNEKDINSYYLSYWDNLKEMTLISHEFLNNKEDVTFFEKIKLKADNYIKIYGNDLILDVNPFNKFQVNLPNYKVRQTPFNVSRGFVDEDEFTFNLENLTVDTELKDISLDSEFGSYRLSFELKDNTLIVKRYFKLNTNNYQKSDYEKFVEFFSQISKYDNTKLSLKLT